MSTRTESSSKENEKKMEKNFNLITFISGG
jgi:hypothetical protein